MCDRVPEPTVCGWGYLRLLSRDVGGGYEPVTERLLERVLLGLRRLAE